MPYSQFKPGFKRKGPDHKPGRCGTQLPSNNPVFLHLVQHPIRFKDFMSMGGATPIPHTYCHISLNLQPKGHCQSAAPHPQTQSSIQRHSLPRLSSFQHGRDQLCVRDTAGSQLYPYHRIHGNQKVHFHLPFP